MSCFFFFKNLNDSTVDQILEYLEACVKKKDKQTNSCMSQTEEVMADFRSVFSEI